MLCVLGLDLSWCMLGEQGWALTKPIVSTWGQGWGGGGSQKVNKEPQQSRKRWADCSDLEAVCLVCTA